MRSDPNSQQNKLSTISTNGYYKKVKTALIVRFDFLNGAGDENRTHVASLEG